MSKGIGNVERRGENKYRLTVNNGFDSKGRRIRLRKNVVATSDREAEKMLAMFVSEVERGVVKATTNITFKELSNIFLKEYAEKNLSPKTYHSYKCELESKIIPAIGHIKVQDIKPLHLQKLYNSLRTDGARADGRAGGLSSKSINNYHKMISSIFNKGVKWKLTNSNPAEDVDAPRVIKKEAHCLNDEQVQQLLNALDKVPIKYKTAVILAVSTGLRRGEILGLEWDDINFDKCTVRVNKSNSYVPGKGTFTKQPKTASSNRDITIPKEVVGVLKEYKNWQNEEIAQAKDIWVNSGKLFTQWNGAPMHADTLSAWFHKFLKENNLPALPFHGLRHTCASILGSHGLEIAAISKRLGHSRTSTTLDIYTHVITNVDNRAADIMENVLSKNKIDKEDTSKKD